MFCFEKHGFHFKYDVKKSLKLSQRKVSISLEKVNKNFLKSKGSTLWFLPTEFDQKIKQLALSTKKNFLLKKTLKLKTGYFESPNQHAHSAMLKKLLTQTKNQKERKAKP